jgi:chemotaxis protein CheX
MNVKYINPFVKSVFNAMKIMLKVVPKRGVPYLKDHNKAQGDISGIVGFAAKNIFGTLAISFPQYTSTKAFELMVGEKVNTITDDVRDFVGELANIIIGGAKKEFVIQDLPFDISIPTVVVGQGHTISHKGGTPVLVIPFTLDESEFRVEVSMKVDGAAAFTESKEGSKAVAQA